MASAYLPPMQTAAALFPLLALALTPPATVVLHRRHGVISCGRTLSLLGFGYYVLTALCMTLVPLPERTPDFRARHAAVAEPQWIPGNVFRDIWREADRQFGLGPLVLHNPAVAGALLNVLLLLPLGVFIRCHLRRGAGVALAAGFAVSLFVELTQFTGLWGLYPAPYRLFDVDDLLTNTGGAALGALLSGALKRKAAVLARTGGRVLVRREVPSARWRLRPVSRPRAATVNGVIGTPPSPGR